jgi:probable rRNA maturation factor
VTPALDLAIQGHARFDDLPARATLRRWISAALDRDAEIALRFVDARESRRLNRNFRGKDSATDVLTFDYAHTPVVRADIILCLPVVKRAARERRRLLRDHLAHLVVHGTLHARGLDPDNPTAAQAMEAREVSILARLGFANPYLG